MVTCFAFFYSLAGLMALFMRAELAAPGLQFLSNEQYNQLFTMHGTHHVAVLRHADRVRLCKPGAAVADRRPGCGVSTAERVFRTGCFCSAA